MTKPEAIINIQDKIDSLSLRLKTQLAQDEPIDPKRIEELISMRRDRDLAYRKFLMGRMDEMKLETLRWMNRKPLFNGHEEKLLSSNNEALRYLETRYDEEALRWVDEEVCPWKDSAAARTAEEILDLFK